MIYEELETQNLRLRAFTEKDSTVITKLLKDKEIFSTTMSLPYPYKEKDATSWISQHPKRHLEYDAFLWCLEERSESTVIGSIELTLNIHHMNGELGYWIGRDYWNKGYATEAAKEIIRFSFEKLKLHKVCARHMTRNPSSGRVMKKLGMKHEGTLREQCKKEDTFEDIEIYGILI